MSETPLEIKVSKGNKDAARMWTCRTGADVNMVPKERELDRAFAIAAAFSNGDGAGHPR